MNINLTLVVQMVAFAIFVAFCMKYVWPPLLGAIIERQKKIAEGLAAAEKGEHDLVLAKESAVNTLKEAKAESAKLVEQAKKRHSEIVESAKDDAREEAEKILKGARAEIEQEVNRAKEQLRAQLAGLAVAGAEKILERNIDAAQQNDIVEKLVTEL
ncbi:F0F1 ATP synthase subunit B [Pleionea mediterranea]|uniref:ATP synthase subunit b n=1 Tax=Pleionea mediterranea TaxID=523701 RepID=A0A316FGE2_9GAMM|nr:F0F1 ATP synthase subunit B [Pleionea mediterranea]PWK46786.1 ATP synthase F0 subcomplex B subunit [Pleionea mediterranea]